MNLSFTHPARFARVTLAVLLGSMLLGGCGMLDSVFGGNKVDYRNNTTRAQPLDVPPDLTQLARDSRYQTAGGVVSAAAAGSAPATVGAAALPPAVAVANEGDIRVMREGQQRWLAVPLSPEALWPQLRTFWESNGFTIESENVAAGVMETNWSENRAKLPADAVRNTLGRLLGNLYDSGERDRYRTRVERTPAGTSEVYITHRGLEEVYTSERHETTAWRARPNDPQLEAVQLSRLMLALGAKPDPARTTPTAVANNATPVPAPARLERVATTPGSGPSSLVIDESFDRAWRRVGLALDRGGFTVEDRDRTAGLYYVRYVDPKSVGKDEPGWWSRLWGDGKNPAAPQRYRIAVKPNGENTKTTVSVQTTAGAPETGEHAQRIVGLLANDLR